MTAGRLLLVVALIVTAPLRAWGGIGEKGAICNPMNDDCQPGLVCQDGYCCDRMCDRECEACNAADRWQMPGKNGTCTFVETPKPPREGHDCGAYLCSGRGPFCAARCEQDNLLCAPGYYCTELECRKKLGEGASCQADSDCSSGSCQRLDGTADGGGPRVCCDMKCEGPCVACVRQLTGLPTDGKCGHVLSQAAGGPPDRCTKEVPLTCGHNGYCDGKGLCAFVAEHTPVGIPTCSENDAGMGVACVTQSCDGLGGVTCQAEICPGRCENGVGCIKPPDAGADADAASEPTDGAADVSVDAPSFDANCPEGRCEASTCDKSWRDGGCYPCRNQSDCVRPNVCHRDGTCRPGRAGEQCWPEGSEVSETPSVFDPDGSCRPGNPDEATEIVGRCSAAPRGRGSAGWQAVIGVLVALSARRARRFRVSTER